ncbi:MAG: hypothetical protein P4M11_15415 [Candidatus Pacebacteria bacterium]|nr:hypothetical protein [Candidatus Paceibacterota bacterium]
MPKSALYYSDLAQVLPVLKESNPDFVRKYCGIINSKMCNRIQLERQNGKAIIRLLRAVKELYANSHDSV